MKKKALLVTRVSGFVPQFEMNNVRLLQEMGYEVHYAANFDVVVYGKDNTRLDGTGIIRHPIPFGRSPFSPDVLKCCRMLEELMLREQFSLIHCHMPMTGILARRAAQAVRRKTKREVPVIYTAHGFHFFDGAPFKNWIYYLPERYYARYTDTLVVINREDYERAKKFPVRGSAAYVPGVGMRDMPQLDKNYSLKKTYNIPEGHKVAVSVGELSARKNHREVIRAMELLEKEPITYLICGSGARKEALLQEVKERHLTNRVLFAGYCPQVADVLSQADFFVFPSKQEGLPVAMMEAMQAGLPVVAADIRGNRDLIEDKKGGFLLSENCAEEYARAISSLLKNPGQAEQMGAWNRERVKQFSLERVERRMREIYQKAEGMGKNG